MTHWFHITPRLLFVAFVSLAWTGFVLWLTLPRLEDIGGFTSVAVAVALIVVAGIVSAIQEVQLISLRIFGDELDEPPER
jgi:hypothetical protein